jgi:hypothetical protein
MTYPEEGPAGTSITVETAPKEPQDDGFKSRKFLTAVIGAGAVFLVATMVLLLATLDVRGAADSVVKLGFGFDDWSGLMKTLLFIVVVGYGAVNLGEKWTLTR